MKTENLFYLNTLRCEVAMQQVLKFWLPPDRNPHLECPKCHSTSVYLGQRKNQPIYRCRSCQSELKHKPLIDCSSCVPGSQPKCHDCRHFQEFLEEVKRVADNLRGLNEKELQNLKADAD